MIEIKIENEKNVITLAIEKLLTAGMFGHGPKPHN